MAQTSATRLLWAALVGLALAIPAFSQTAPAAAPAPIMPVLTFNGYIQARAFEGIGTTTKAQDGFALQRGYFITTAKIGDNVSARLVAKQTASSSDTGSLNLIEAWGQYAMGNYAVKAGLVGIPFGYENPLSSSKLITLERSAISMAQVYNYAFDRGVCVGYMPKTGPNLVAAVVNGANLYAPANTDNTVNGVMRVGDNTKWGNVGVSLYNGRLNNASEQILGFDGQSQVGPCTVQTELIQAKNGNVTSDGGYLTLAYKPSLVPNCQPYARYDVYDANVANASRGDYFQRITLGANYFLNPFTRVTLEYQGIGKVNNAAYSTVTSTHGQVAGQLQVSF